MEIKKGLTASEFFDLVRSFKYYQKKVVTDQ